MSELQRFTNTPTSVTEARHFVASLLGRYSSEIVESATLMVSELATNCVRHAHSGFSVLVDVDRSRIRVEVTDDGAGQPTMRTPEPTELSGRGLRIVELLASEWGIAESAPAPGKRVWFTLPVTAPAV